MFVRPAILWFAALLVGCAGTEPSGMGSGSPAGADARPRADGGSTSTGPDANAGCGAVTAQGSCQGSILSFCDMDRVLMFDCAQDQLPCTCSGGLCDCDDGTGSGPPDGGTGGGGPCGTVTYHGSCSGDTVTWCESDMVRSVNCAEFGYQCQCTTAVCDCV